MAPKTIATLLILSFFAIAAGANSASAEGGGFRDDDGFHGRGGGSFHGRGHHGKRPPVIVGGFVGVDGYAGGYGNGSDYGNGGDYGNEDASGNGDVKGSGDLARNLYRSQRLPSSGGTHELLLRTHKDSIRWHYRCQLYPVTHHTLRDIAEQFQRWVKERAEKRNIPIVEAPKGRRDEFVGPYFEQAKPEARDPSPT